MTTALTTSTRNLLRVAKNALSLFSGSIAVRLANVLFTSAIVRHLSTTDYGVYSTILSFLAVGGLVAEFGLSQVLVREIAQQKDKISELLSGAILMAVPLVMIAVGGTITAAVVSGYSLALCTLLAFSSIAIFTNTLGLLAGTVLRAFERMEVLSLVNSGVLIVSVAIGIFWLEYGAGLQELTVLLVVTSVVNSLFMLICIRRYWAGFALMQALQVGKGLLSSAVPIAIFGLCNVILQRFDVLLLSRSWGMSEAGTYSAALAITEALALIIQSVVGAVFPFMAVRWPESAVDTMRSYEQTLRFLVVVGMAIAAGVFLLADKMVLLLYDERYLGTMVCLRIVIWSFTLNALGGPVGMLLVVTKDRLVRYVPYALVVTVISVLLNVWLTPRFGYIAAGGITVLVSALLFISKILALSKILPARPQWLKIAWRSMIAATLMGGTLWKFRNHSLIMLIIVGFAVYSVALVALGEFKEEYRTIRRYLRKSKA